jgi:hypothetical protein
VSRARRAALFLAGLTWLTACAKVIGVSGYSDAVGELCGPCDEIPDCEAALSTALETASAAEREAWLQTFDELDCAHAACDTTALACFFAGPGLCAEKEGPCKRSVECCGYDVKNPKMGARCAAGPDDGDAEGACRDGCFSCPELLGRLLDKETTDAESVCLQDKDKWAAVDKCRQDKGCDCKSALGCGVCMKLCKPQTDACNENAPP